MNKRPLETQEAWVELPERLPKRYNSLSSSTSDESADSTLNNHLQQDTQAAETREETDSAVYYVLDHLLTDIRDACTTLHALWADKEPSTVPLAFQYVVLLIAGFRSSLVSVLYVLYWQITLPLLLSRHRKVTIRSKSFRISQILVLSLATINLVAYIVYFSVVAFHPDLDAGKECHYFSQDDFNQNFKETIDMLGLAAPQDLRNDI